MEQKQSGTGAAAMAQQHEDEGKRNAILAALLALRIHLTRAAPLDHAGGVTENEKDKPRALKPGMNGRAFQF